MKPAPKAKLSARAQRVKAELADVITARRNEITREKGRKRRGRGITKADLEAIRDGRT